MTEDKIVNNDSPKHHESADKFKDWTQINCMICADPIRELYTESPLDLNEHTNLSIVVLSCNHCFHYSCIYEWLKRNAVCPYCRADTPINTLKNMIYPPVRCCATISRSNRVGEQCECLEYPHNMGFCRKHLPPLDELIPRFGDISSSHSFDLGNRKLLTILKYQHLNALPPDIKKEILATAHSIVIAKSNEKKTLKVLLKELEIPGGISS